MLIDNVEKPVNWLHPADIIRISDIRNQDENHLSWQMFTDESKSEQGTGSGVVIDQLRIRLENQCSNNQAE